MTNIFLKILVLIAILITVIKAVIVPLIKELLRLRKIKKRGKVTFGVITGYNEKKDLDRYNQYAKIVEFKTESNERIIFESIEYTFQKPLIGKSIKVLYDQQNPQNAIEDFNKIFAFKLFLIILVCIILLFIFIVSMRISYSELSVMFNYLRCWPEFVGGQCVWLTQVPIAVRSVQLSTMLA